MALEQVTDKSFKETVLDVQDKPVLVDFWAEWCGPCRMLTPIIESLSEKYKDQLKVFKLDTETNPTTAQEYKITSIPCCILFKNGKEIDRFIGFKPQPSFEADLVAHL